MQHANWKHKLVCQFLSCVCSIADQSSHFLLRKQAYWEKWSPEQCLLIHLQVTHHRIPLLRCSVCLSQSIPYGKTHCYKHPAGCPETQVLYIFARHIILPCSCTWNAKLATQNEYVKTDPCTAGAKADDAHKCVFVAFFHCEWTSTITLAGICPFVVTAKHIILDKALHWCRAHSCNSKFITAWKAARALFTLLVTEDCLSCFLQNGAARRHGFDTVTRMIFLAAPTINWSSFSSVVFICWCKASWGVFWQVNLLFQLQEGNIMHIVKTITIVDDYLLNLQNFPSMQVMIIQLALVTFCHRPNDCHQYRDRQLQLSKCPHASPVTGRNIARIANAVQCHN